MIGRDEFTELVSLARDSQNRHSGGNSTVVRVDWNGRQVAIKDYNARADATVRLRRELDGLRLLWSQGLRITPEPLGADFTAGFGAQAWLPGISPTMRGATVSAMAAALRALHKVASGLPLDASARWAADSIRDVADMDAQVRQRVAQLKGSSSRDVAHLLQEIAVAVGEVTDRTGEFGRWVPTLSPSDFGPHNMLHDQTTDAWSLIDLEFFGWDDAHKLACDTLMHPLISWKGDLAGQFLESVVQTYDLDIRRLLALYPWCSLKWATIVANRAVRESVAGRSDKVEEAIAAANSYVLRALAFSRFERDPAGLEALLRWESSR